MHSRLPTITLLVLYFHFNSLVYATPNSVCAQSGWALLRPCAAYCIGCDSRPDQIGYEIGCGAVPPNECWCRIDMFIVATSALSSCVSKSCTIGGWENDYSSAEYFYQSYCLGAGFTALQDAPANTAATTTGDPNAPTVTQVTYVTQTIGSTSSGSLNSGGQTSSFTTTTIKQVTVDTTSTIRVYGSNTSNGPNAGGGGMSFSDKVALGVGIGIGLPATIAALVTCCLQMGRMN